MLGTRELREQLPGILREFREDGSDASPIVGGAAERAEGRESLGGRSLEDAAVELDFDPDELFTGAPPAEDAAATR